MKRFAETIFRPRKQHRTSHNPSASDQPPQETTGGPTLPNPRPRLETGRTGPFLESTPSVSLATVLCSSCRNIFSGDPDRFQSWDSQMKLWKNHQLEHHRTALSFADALSQQCYICTRAHKALRSEYLETPLELLPSFNSNAFSAYEVHIAHLVHKKDDKVRSEATITILQPSFKHGNEIRIVAYSSKGICTILLCQISTLKSTSIFFFFFCEERQTFRLHTVDGQVGFSPNSVCNLGGNTNLD